MGKRPPTSDAGPSQRRLRVGELIRRALSDVLNRGDLHDPDLDRMSVTVGECRPSPDLRHVTVFVSPLGRGDAAAMLAALERNRAELRRAVTRAVTLKYSPELHFQSDTIYDRIEETNRWMSDAKVQESLGRIDE